MRRKGQMSSEYGHPSFSSFISCAALRHGCSKTRGRFFCLGIRVQALCYLNKQAVGRRMIPCEDGAKESNSG